MRRRFAAASTVRDRTKRQVRVVGKGRGGGRQLGREEKSRLTGFARKILMTFWQNRPEAKGRGGECVGRRQDQGKARPQGRA